MQRVNVTLKLALSCLDLALSFRAQRAYWLIVRILCPRLPLEGADSVDRCES